jgi:hypothetical protein
MASAIPMALSLFHTVASQYPGLQNPGNPATTAAPPAASGNSAPPPSAPMNIPGALPNNPPPAGGLGVSPSSNSSSPPGMCIVSLPDNPTTMESIMRCENICSSVSSARSIMMGLRCISIVASRVPTRRRSARLTGHRGLAMCVQINC